jgi:hypothetical protein
MKLTVKEKQKATRITAARYQKGSKKKKGAILDEFIALTGTVEYGYYAVRYFINSQALPVIKCSIRVTIRDCYIFLIEEAASLASF